MPPHPVVVGDLLEGDGGHHGDLGASGQQTLDLSGGHRTSTDDQDTTSGQVEVDWVRVG